MGRALTAVAAAVFAVIAVGILFVVLEGNRDNGIVDFFVGLAETLAGPFKQLFQIENRELEVTVNWGIAAVAYLVAARLVASLIERFSEATDPETEG